MSVTTTAENLATEMEPVLDQLAALGGADDRDEFLRHYERFIGTALVEAACLEVSRVLWFNMKRTRGLIAGASWLAEVLDDDRCRALALRAAANASQIACENDEAQKLYEAALQRFESIDDESEAAITRSSALQNMAFLADYEKVVLWEEAAREVFERQGNRLRLAILDNNYASILTRQDRWEAALKRYQQAHDEFLELGRANDVAVCLHNIAVCHISLHNFSEALHVYQRNRLYSSQQGLTRLVLQADYNIAYLYYLRGEYTSAIRRYRDVRRRCEEEGDGYHHSLCDLDLAEIYLELNMVDEAASLARAAIEGFDELRLPYESAKALTNSAIALSRQGKGSLALDELKRAREMFVKERNRLWPTLIDFYQAVVLYRDDRLEEARTMAEAARVSFSLSSLQPKTVMCELLLAEILIALGRPREAREVIDGALERLGSFESPALEHQAYLVLGQVGEALGDRRGALGAYRQSLAQLEKLRSQLQGEELKIAFLSDKRMVFESLVWLTMQDSSLEARKEATFEYIEQSRSRSLADLMSFRAHELPATHEASSTLTNRVRSLREELNWFYRQLDLQQMRGGERSLEEIEKIRKSMRGKEDELLSSLREIGTADQEYSSLQSGAVIDLESVRASLPEDAVLVEYFIARGMIFGCVVERSKLEIVPLGQASKTQAIHRRLQFQLSRSMLGPEQIRDTQPIVEKAIQAHLSDLYDELITPLAPHLNRQQLIIVPHAFLHYVPFHALTNGRECLIESHSISYAPSAGVFHLCATKEVAPEECSLVLGVADERAPFIRDEARAVAEALPQAMLLLGEEASADALVRYGVRSRFVHIATHGLFRRDNPMFSAIQLGTSRLSLFDLYNLRLNAEMVVLSGCGTGLNAVLGADELVGLTRGLLYAGAQSVVVSLWDVNDASTAIFMRRFYEHLARGSHRARALQRTMLDLRESHPNPYYWAPFFLVGKPG